MLSIKPKTAFTNILEGGLPPTAINGHFDHYAKTDISEPPAVLFKTVSSLSHLRLTSKYCLSIFR